MGPRGGSSQIRVTSWWQLPTDCDMGTGQRWMSCAVERIIRLLKPCLEQTLDGKRCSIEEVKTLLHEACPSLAESQWKTPLADDLSPLFICSWDEV